MAKSPRLSKRQLEMWDQINEAAQASGAWVVSESHKNPIRLEATNFILARRLELLNYDIRNMGCNERLVPIGSGHGPGTVFVFEIRLPSDRKAATSEIPR